MSENKSYISREDEDKEVSLRDSEKAVGQLLPVILDAYGKPVDGLHRLESNPDWRTEQHPEIKTDEDYWKVRAHLNYVRRKSGEAKKEKKIIIEGLCEYYEKQGYNVRSSERSEGHQGGGNYQNEILEAVILALDGAIKEQYIRDNFPDKYKQTQKPREAPLKPATVIATIAKAEPTVDLETSEGLFKAAKVLEHKAKEKIIIQKTPEQLASEKAEKERKKLEKETKDKIQREINDKKMREKILQEVTQEVKQELKEEVKQEVIQQLASEEKTASDILNEKKILERKEANELLKEEIKTLKPPEGKFEVIVIDPPWNYGTEYDPESRRVASPYPEMTTEEIMNISLPVNEENCMLFMWTTNAFMHDAYHIIERWGFEPKTILTWVKDRMGIGYWLRGITEHVIIAVKGKPDFTLTNQTTVLYAKNRGHSIKPDEFYDFVDRYVKGRKLDYFSREGREGWETFGTMERATD